MTLTLRQPLAAVCLAASLLSLGGCATSTTAVTEPTSATEVAAAHSDLATFHRLIQQAGLATTLSTGTYTVFAPTDEAFKALPAATLDKLTRDPEFLKSVLTYHVLPQRLAASGVQENASVATLQGAKITIAKAGDVVTVDEAIVTRADLPAGGSVVHVIDTVLLPPVKK